MNAQVGIVKCGSYDSTLVEVSVRKVIGLIGGLTQYIKPGSRVLVKPNMLMAKEPETGIDTHPEVVRAMLRLLKEINCRIFVGDSPSVWGGEIENVDEVYRISGIAEVCRQENVELVNFDKRRMRLKFPLTAWLDHCDYLVSIPKLKTHGLMVLSAGIKNNFGLVSGTFKTELHKNYFRPNDFAGILADIYAEARPALTIVDGIVAMEGDGPATNGKLRNLGLLFSGSDCVALDAVIAKTIGIEPLDILTTKIAAERGLGIADLGLINIAGEKPEDLKIQPFLLPAASLLKKKTPEFLIHLAGRLIKYYPYPVRKNCIRCSACVKICPYACITMKKKGIIFDYKRCISCFCCQETCPAKAIEVKKSLFARMIGL